MGFDGDAGPPGRLVATLFVFLVAGVTVAGDDDRISLQEIQRGIYWWSEDQSVPDTGGEIIDIRKLQSLIDAWSDVSTVTCT